MQVGFQLTRIYFYILKKSKKSNLHVRNEMKRIIFGYRNKHKFIQDFPYDNWSRKLLHLNDQKMMSEIEIATKIIIPDTHILMYNQDYAHQGSSIGQLFKRFWLLTRRNIQDDVRNGPGPEHIITIPQTPIFDYKKFRSIKDQVGRSETMTRSGQPGPG